jgi:cytochrome c biogenesis protein CcmG, thiol:disulfide interchange protein DsbE
VRHPARWIALAVAVVVVTLGVVLALNVGTDPQAAAKTSRLLGRPAPDFELRDLAGGTVSSDALAGKTVVVNFWNEWCIPCLQELPALKQFWDAHGGDGDVEMVGIVREPRMGDAKLARYVEKDGLDWTIALDPDSRAALDFATRGQPETFVISPTGEIAGYQLGPATVSGLEAMLTAARGYS